MLLRRMELLSTLTKRRYKHSTRLGLEYEKLGLSPLAAPVKTSMDFVDVAVKVADT